MSSSKALSFMAVRKQRDADLANQPSADALVNNLRQYMMPHQRELLDSTSRRDAVLAPRQTGKSWAVILLIFASCLMKANAQWVLIGPTLKSLKRIYLPVIKLFNFKLKLGLVHNKTDGTFTFPNGSIIYFFGADKAEEAEKLRGSTLDGVVVDEAQMYPIDQLRYLIQAVVEKALAIKRGRLILIGTPGEVLMGDFYEATSPKPIEYKPGVYSRWRLGTKEKGFWCYHHWTPQANVSAPHYWQDALEDKERRGWADDHPTWRRESLGEWVATYDVIVYSSFNPYRNVYDELPKLPNGAEPWRFVLGVDLGETDGTAMVVWAYSPSWPDIYEVYSKKEYSSDERKLTAGFLAAWRNELVDQFGNFDAEVCDPGGLAGMLLNTLEETHSVFWEKAEVRQKEDHIKLLNDDFTEGRAYLKRDSALAFETARNRWLKDKKLGVVPPVGKRKEDPKTPNDLCDAALYAFRWCYHRLYRPVAVHTPSALQKANEEARDAVRQHILASMQTNDERSWLSVPKEDPCLDLK